MKFKNHSAVDPEAAASGESESPFTPGPWKLEGLYLREVRPPEMLLADLYCAPQRYTEKAANARLIAAAPEMLEALKIAKTYVDALLSTYAAKSQKLGLECTFPALRSHQEKIDAVIAKAEGRAL